jgi:hypothetical protein
MTKRERPAIRPRIVNDAQLASYLGRSLSWLGQHRHELEAQGFPRRLPVVGGNDLEKVDHWLDQQHTTNGRGTDSAADALWLKATGMNGNVGRNN